MVGQTALPDEGTSSPLQLETGQAGLSQDVASKRNTRFLWAGCGFAVLMLIGVGACALLHVPMGSSSKLTPSSEVAFMPVAFPATRPVALTPGTVSHGPARAPTMLVGPRRPIPNMWRQPQTLRQPRSPITAMTAVLDRPQSASTVVVETTEETQHTKDKVPVGVAEDRHFKCDESVTFWKEFKSGSGAPENMQEVASIMSSIGAMGTQGQQYVLAAGLRTGYMSGNAVLGTLAFELAKRSGTRKSEGAVGEESGGPSLLSNGLNPAFDLLSNFLLQAALCYRQDFRSINSGLFKAPWDMFTPTHRQYTPQYAVDKTLRFVGEAMKTLGRREDQKLPGIWLRSPFYPEYTKNDFHYQTDGWMSSDSAKVYETSTETLFVGRQDAMQRVSLLPLRNVAAARGGKPRILEVACGTGRFATFIRDNHPTADMTLLDLSPFYLEAAKENDDYWRKTAYPNEATRPPAATMVQAPAEKLPFEDGSFDAVVNVYLFHEMPDDARAAAAAEMARVVAPGGIVVLTDSIQRGDVPTVTSEGAKAFGKLNEPHYEKYIDTYIPDLFTSAGLECDGKWVESSTKCLSFRKPAVQDVIEKTEAQQDVPSDVATA